MRSVDQYYREVAPASMKKDLEATPDKDVLALGVENLVEFGLAKYTIPPLGKAFSNKDVNVDPLDGDRIESELRVTISLPGHPRLRDYFDLQPRAYEPPQVDLTVEPDLVRFQVSAPQMVEPVVEKIRGNIVHRDQDIDRELAGLSGSLRAVVSRHLSRLSESRDAFNRSLESLPYKVNLPEEDDGGGEEGTDEDHSASGTVPTAGHRLIPDEAQHAATLEALDELLQRASALLDGHRDELPEVAVEFLEEVLIPGLGDLRATLVAEVDDPTALDTLRERGRSAFKASRISLKGFFMMSGALDWSVGVLGDSPAALDSLESIGRAAGIT